MPGSQGRRLLDEVLGRLRVRPLSTIDVPSVSLMLSYARQGLGIGLVPELALARGRPPRLAIERADVPAIDVRLTCRPTLKRTRPVARFLAGLVDEARRVSELRDPGRAPRDGLREAKPRSAHALTLRWRRTA